MFVQPMQKADAFFNLPSSGPELVLAVHKTALVLQIPVVVLFFQNLSIFRGPGRM